MTDFPEFQPRVPSATKANWVPKFARYIRRQYLERALTQGESPQTARREAFALEAQYHPQEVAQRLLNEEYMEDSLSQQLFEAFWQKIHERFPDQFVALVKAGSAIHGGKLVRMLLGTEAYGDIDFALIYTDERERNLADDDKERKDKLTNGEKTQLAVIWQEVQQQLIPENKHVSPVFEVLGLLPVLIDLHQAISLFNQERGSSRICAYLSPTIPAQVGEENQRIIHLALHQVYLEQGGQAWQKIVQEILDSWQNIRVFREKHFTFPDQTVKQDPKGSFTQLPESQRSLDLLLALIGSKVRSEHMQNWLNSSKEE